MADYTSDTNQKRTSYWNYAKKKLGLIDDPLAEVEKEGEIIPPPPKPDPEPEQKIESKPETKPAMGFTDTAKAVSEVLSKSLLGANLPEHQSYIGKIAASEYLKTGAEKAEALKGAFTRAVSDAKSISTEYAPDLRLEQMRRKLMTEEQRKEEDRAQLPRLTEDRRAAIEEYPQTTQEREDIARKNLGKNRVSDALKESAKLYEEGTEEYQKQHPRITAFAKAGARIPVDLAALSLATELTGNPTAGFAATSATEEYGRGGDGEDVLKAGTQGAIVGKLFEAVGPTRAAQSIAMGAPAFVERYTEARPYDKVAMPKYVQKYLKTEGDALKEAVFDPNVLASFGIGALLAPGGSKAKPTETRLQTEVRQEPVAGPKTIYKTPEQLRAEGYEPTRFKATRGEHQGKTVWRKIDPTTGREIGMEFGDTPKTTTEYPRAGGIARAPAGEGAGVPEWSKQSQKWLDEFGGKEEKTAMYRMPEEVTVKDIAGNPHTIKAGEEVKTRTVGNKTLVHDGVDFVANNNQLQNMTNRGIQLGEQSKTQLAVPEDVQVVKKSDQLRKKQSYVLRNSKGDVLGSFENEEQARAAGTKHLETTGDRPFYFSEDISYEASDITPKYKQYITNAGDNYTETLITAPNTLKPSEQAKYADLNAPDIEPKPIYKSPHWDEPNVIAHNLTSEKTTVDGKKAFEINEAQSDWSKDLRTPDKLPRKEPRPDHPHVKNWLDLSMKQALKDAVDSGADYLTWNSGQTVADRYDLSKQIDRVAYRKDGPDTYEISAIKDGDSVITQHGKTAAELEGIIGKDVAKKIIAGEGTPRSGGGNVKDLAGIDLKIGGEWAQNLYDVQIPSKLKELTKKYGGRIENIEVGTAGATITQPALILTPELKAAITTGLQPRGGGIARGDKKISEQADVSYRIAHQIGDGRPASSLDNLKDIIVEHRERNGYLTNYDLSDLKKLQKMQGNPDMDVVIYRASPIHQLNAGDWVTTSRVYAGDIKNVNGGKVYKYTVKAKNLIYPNDLSELPSLARFSAFKYMPSQQSVESQYSTALAKEGGEVRVSIDEAKAKVERLAAELGVALHPIEVMDYEKVVDPTTVEGVKQLRDAGLSPEEIQDAIQNKYKYVVDGEHTLQTDASGQKRSKITLFRSHDETTLLHEFAHAVEEQGGLPGWAGTKEQHAQYLADVLYRGDEGKLAEFTKTYSKIQPQQRAMAQVFGDNPNLSIRKLDDTPIDVEKEIDKIQAIKESPEHVAIWNDIYSKAAKLPVGGMLEFKGAKLEGIATLHLTVNCQRDNFIRIMKDAKVLPESVPEESCYGGSCYKDRYVYAKRTAKHGAEAVKAASIAAKPIKIATPAGIAKLLSNPSTVKAINDSRFIRLGQSGDDSHAIALGLAEEWLKQAKSAGVTAKSVFVTSAYAPTTAEMYQRLAPYKDMFVLHVTESGYFSRQEILNRFNEFVKANNAGLNVKMRVITNRDLISHAEAKGDIEKVGPMKTDEEKFLFDLIKEYDLNNVILETPTAVGLQQEEPQRVVGEEFIGEAVSQKGVPKVSKERLSYNPEKINAPKDVEDLFKQVAAEKGEFRGQRPVKASKEEIERLADLVGLTPEALMKVKAGSIANAETVYKSRQIVMDLAKDLSDYIKTIDTATATPEQLKVYKDKFLRLQGAMKTVAGFRTEASNLFRQFQFEVSPHEDAYIREMLADVKKIDQAAGGDLELLARKTKELTDPTWGDKFWHLWYASILSGPSTHLKNIIGNVSQLTWELGRIATTQPQHFPRALAGLVLNIGPAVKAAVKVFKEGTPSKFEARGLKPIVFRGNVTRILNLADYVGRTLEGVDTFFKTTTGGMELRQLAWNRAKADGLTGQARRDKMKEYIANPPKDMLEQVDDYKRYMTYQQAPEGILGLLARGIGRAAGADPRLRLIVPFTNVVANVANNAIDWTPYGLVRTGRDYYRSQRGKESHSSRRRGQDLGRAIIGTLGMAVAAALAADDKMTGSGPSNYAKKSQLMASGWKPNSFVFTDKDGNKTYVPYTHYVGPMAVALGIVANYMDAVKYGEMDEKDALSRASLALLGTGNLILDMSFLKGVSDLLTAVANKDMFGPNYIKRFITQQGASLYPNLIKQVDRYFDPTVYDPTTIVEGLQNATRITDGLRPKLDVYGDPIIGDRLTQLSPSKQKKDDIKTYMAENRLWISVPSKSTQLIDVDKAERRDMTPAEYYDYVKISGQKIKEMLVDFKDVLETLPDQETKQNWVDKQVNKQREAVKKMMQGDVTPTPSGGNAQNKLPNWVTKQNQSPYHVTKDERKPGERWELSYAPHILEASKITGIPAPKLLAVIKQESGGNPNAISSMGAVGLMQIMPKNITGQGYDKKYDLTTTRGHILAGADFLKKMLVAAKGDWIKALMYYNAGEPAVNAKGYKPTRQTANYIKRIPQHEAAYREEFDEKLERIAGNVR